MLFGPVLVAPHIRAGEVVCGLARSSFGIEEHGQA